MYNIRNFLYEGGKLGMKKKRFMKLLALASCVTLLTGCESEAFFGLGKYVNQVADWGPGLLEKLGLKEAEKKDEKQSEDKPSGGEQSGEQGGQEGGGQEGGGQEGGGEGGGGQVTPEPEVSISFENLPEDLYMGDTLDLDQYVKLENATEFSVALSTDSQEIASLEGHVITVTGEGTLEFTVSAGEASEEASVTVYSFLRSLYYYSFKDIGKHYTVYGYDYYEDATTGEEEDYLSTIIYHSDNYVYQEHYDENGAMEWNQGLLIFDGAYSYEFEVAENASTGDPEVSLVEKYPVSVFNNWNPEFDAMYYFGYYAEAEWSEQSGESLVLYDNYAAYFAQEVLFTAGLQDSSGTSYDVTAIELGAVNISTDESSPEYVFYGSCYLTPEGGEGYYWYLDFEFDLEDYGIDFLEAYCVPENAPNETDYYADYFEGHVISDFFLSPAQSSVLGSSGYVQYSAAVYDSEGNVVEQPANSFMNQYYGANLPVLSGLMFYGENSMWEVDGSYDFVSGYMNTGNGVFFAAATGDTDNPVYAESVSSYQSAWDSNLGFPGLFVENNWKNSISSVAVDDESNPSMHQFTFNAGQYSNLFTCLMNGIGNEAFFTYLDWIDYAFGGLDLLEYLPFTLTIAPSMGMAQFNFSYNSSLFSNYSVSGYFYKISITFVADSSVASLVDAYEAAVAPYCVAA